MPLNPEMGAGSYVTDFVKSKNSRFKGKPKKKRIQMALGAYYGAKKKANSSSPYTADNNKYGGFSRRRKTM